MSAAYLTRVDPARNMARFYKLDVQPTLFGEFAVAKEWGRIGRAGQVRSTPFPSSAEANTALARQKAIKEAGMRNQNQARLACLPRQVFAALPLAVDGK
jgi:predicted DNA-binding WGR domain protein